MLQRTWMNWICYFRKGISQTFISHDWLVFWNNQLNSLEHPKQLEMNTGYLS
jgi:hypothetical protein